jgi:hypothetical protein
MERRSFIKKGFIGSVLFGIEPIISYANSSQGKFPDPYKDHKFISLDDKDVEFFKSVCPIILGQVSSIDQWPPEKIMFEVIKGVDIAISHLSVPVKEDLSTLFSLLSFRPTRFVLTGVWAPWEEASYESINSSMDKWSGTGLQVWRSAYDGLRKLILSSWYANPASWQAIGYPGPPKV